MKTLLCTLVVSAFIFSPISQAQSINETQQKQRHRIEQGIKSGELTKREAKHLVHEQRKIARKETAFKSDGEFTKKERARIRHQQAHASKHIHRQKHDKQSRN